MIVNKTLIEAIMDGQVGIYATDRIVITGDMSEIKKIVLAAARKGYKIGLKKGKQHHE